MKPPPLIAHIVYSLDTGGLENGLVNIINRMPSSHCRHMVICLTTSGRFSERIINRERVPIIELRKPPGHSVKTFWRLWRVLKHYQPDIVHSRNLAALECQWITLPLWGVKRVHGEHGRGVADLHGTNWKNNLLRKLSRPLMHHYVAVSQDLQNWLVETIKVNPDRVSQIYNGVDLEQFSSDPTHNRSLPGLPRGFLTDQSIVIGTVGRLTAVKDQRLILEALAGLKQTQGLNPHVRVLIVGDGDLMDELKRLSQRLELSEITYFTGDSNEVHQLLKLMDIFVLPSLVEGISNTLLEAMASELPVVASRVGGTPEIIEHGRQGLLFPSRDSHALAASLQRLIDHPSDRVLMGKAGRKQVEACFNWTNTINNYLAIYQRLLPQLSVSVSQKTTANKAITESEFHHDRRRRI